MTCAENAHIGTAVNPFMWPLDEAIAETETLLKPVIYLNKKPTNWWGRAKRRVTQLEQHMFRVSLVVILRQAA